jgi:DNA polymerase III epsilon subunit-like protein
MYLFFDIESSGLPKNYKIPPTKDINNWPNIVQLSYIRTDKNGNIKCERDFIVKPERFVISKEAEEIHGVSNKMAIEKGISIRKVLKRFNASVRKSDIIIAHNNTFDGSVVMSELIRNKLPLYILDKEWICTMKSSIDLCKIPNKWNNGYKWPKLEELYMYLFNEKIDGAHNALVDVKAASRCFFEMKKRGII